MSDLHSVHYHLESAAFAGLTVHVLDLSFYEALSEPYGAELRITVGDPHFDGAAVLGKDVVLILDRGGSVQRRITGIVREVREGGQAIDEAAVEGGVQLGLVVVPALWMLSRRRDTRIFQDMKVPEILDAVLNGALGAYGRKVKLSLSATYPKREYCVQYQETDLDFAHRLMEEEGIFYAFDHEGDVESMILLDASDAAPAIEHPAGGIVRYVPHNMATRSEEAAHLVHRRHRTTETSVVIGDWDWTRATMPFSQEQRGEDAMGRDRESYEHGHGRSPSIYDYSGTSYGAEDGIRQAGVRLEAHERDTVTIEGVSRVTGLAPGKKLDLSGHDVLGVDGEYLVVRVIHQNVAAESLLGAAPAESADDYHNRFECIPLATPWRPQRQTPKPRVSGLQTAVVTGPGGEEIHVDEHGRIKVQLHWDRVGVNNEKSSCWIRVEQGWAGAGWGFWWVPRIGMEVVVQFVDGDPDRPLVTGSVYNATNPTPYSLPDEKTKSTIKSNSSLGGAGFNEFRYEDKAGSEEIFTHAEKDYNEVVEHDHTTLVHNDQTNTVDNDQTQLVKANQVETVHGKQTMTVDGNRTVHVKTNFDETVDGTETRTVTGDVTESFDANETRTITGNVTETINGNETRTISGNQTESVTGSHTQTVGGSATETITGSLDQTVTGGITTTTPAAYNITATGGYNVTAAAGIRWVAAGGVQVAAPGGMFQTDNFYDWQGAKEFEVAVTSMSIFAIAQEATAVGIGATAFSCTATIMKKETTGMKSEQTVQKLGQVATSVQVKAFELMANGWFNWCV